MLSSFKKIEAKLLLSSKKTDDEDFFILGACFLIFRQKFKPF